MVDVAKLIGDALELGAVIGDGETALLRRTQFGLEVDRALKLVVEDDVLDGAPQGVGGVARLTNGVEDHLSDSGEDPVDDARVNLAPLIGVLLGWGRGLDVTLDAKCDERGVVIGGRSRV